METRLASIRELASVKTLAGAQRPMCAEKLASAEGPAAVAEAIIISYKY